MARGSCHRRATYSTYLCVVSRGPLVRGIVVQGDVTARPVRPLEGRTVAALTVTESNGTVRPWSESSSIDVSCGIGRGVHTSASLTRGPGGGNEDASGGESPGPAVPGVGARRPRRGQAGGALNGPPPHRQGPVPARPAAAAANQPPLATGHHPGCALRRPPHHPTTAVHRHRARARPGAVGARGAQLPRSFLGRLVYWSSVQRR
jgi:hypothetical protein